MRSVDRELRFATLLRGGMREMGTIGMSGDVSDVDSVRRFYMACNVGINN